MVYLGKILGSETKIKILFVLVSNPRASYMEKELAKASNSSVSEVNRQIPDLVNSGLVTIQRLGRTKIYSLNQKHFLRSSLEKLFVDLNKIYKKIARDIKGYAIAKVSSVQTIILVGSLAYGKVREDIVKEPSDIDLIFIIDLDANVSKVKKTLIDCIDKKISSKYGIVLYPFVISRQEYLNRLGRKDRFILDSYVKGEVLYGGKPRRAG